MVFVKVRETYDLKTVRNKMTVIGIHTPKSEIIKRNYPGLLMQCKAFRPVSCDVRVACASVLPLDPLGVGTEENSVAPEDVFNPILYKAMSNKGMSQLETRIKTLGTIYTTDVDVDGMSAVVDVDTVTPEADEFDFYYGLLANTHDWRHANVQSGFEMRGLRPLVYDVVATQGDMQFGAQSGPNVLQPAIDSNGSANDGNLSTVTTPFFLGKAKEMPFIPCTSPTFVNDVTKADSGFARPGFDVGYSGSLLVPEVRIMCGAIIIPPSRLHELFFRMVCEWTIEFSQIRSFIDIAAYDSIHTIGSATHYQNYSYAKVKEIVDGSSDSILDKNDTCMISSNVDVKKVM